MKTLRHLALNPLTGLLWLSAGPAFVGSHYFALRCIGYAAFASLYALVALTVLLMAFMFVEACRGRMAWNDPYLGETESERHGI